MKNIDTPPVQLDELLHLFYPETSTTGASANVGTFHESDAADLSSDAAQLLNHSAHMTVTVEAFHNSEVDVKVLQESDSGAHYSRKILLTRKSDGRVVMFGIVRLDMSTLPSEVQEKIRQREIPLGRILISHEVMRSVKLAKLYRIEAGPELAKQFGVELGDNVYGRTAWIYCNGKPAIELLEVVG